MGKAFIILPPIPSVRETVIDYETVAKEVEVLYCDECDMEVEELYPVAIDPRSFNFTVEGIKSLATLEWCERCVLDRAVDKKDLNPKDYPRVYIKEEKIVQETVKNSIISMDIHKYWTEERFWFVCLSFTLFFPLMFPIVMANSFVDPEGPWRNFIAIVIPGLVWGTALGLLLFFAFLL